MDILLSAEQRITEVPPEPVLLLLVFFGRHRSPAGDHRLEIPQVAGATGTLGKNLALHVHHPDGPAPKIVTVLVVEKAGLVGVDPVPIVEAFQLLLDTDGTTALVGFLLGDPDYKQVELGILLHVGEFNVKSHNGLLKIVVLVGLELRPDLEGLPDLVRLQVVLILLAELLQLQGVNLALDLELHPVLSLFFEGSGEFPPIRTGPHPWLFSLRFVIGMSRENHKYRKAAEQSHTQAAQEEHCGIFSHAREERQIDS